MEDTNCCECCHKKKPRSPQQVRELTNRLSRIEGQVRGIKRMIEENVYCPDILVQTASVIATLNSFNKALLADHIRTCVADDIKEGRDEAIDELLATLKNMLK